MEGAGYSTRTLLADDLPWFLSVRNASRQMLHDSREFSLEEAESWLEESSPDIRVIEFGERPVGYLRVGPAERRGEGRLLWIGCDIAPEERRRGHAEAAYRSFAAQLKAEYEANGLVLRVLPCNGPAISLYRKLGFAPSGLTASRSDDGRSLEISDIEMTLLDGASGVAPDAIDLLIDSGALG